MLWAISMLGVHEAAGDLDNPQVVQFHAATSGGAAPDAVPWCSSFVNWCWKQVGVQGTCTKRARDWVESPPEDFAVALGAGCIRQARVGDVVCLRRGADPNQGHVTFFLSKAADGAFLGLGGNQGNEVSVERYLNVRVLGYARYVGT